MQEIIKDTNEKMDGDDITIDINIPKDVEIKDFKLKHHKNSISISYSKLEKNESDEYKCYSEKYSSFMKTYPFEIKDPKAKFENGMLTIKFRKDDDLKELKNIQIESKSLK